MRLKPIASVLLVFSALLLTACETMMSSNRVVVSAAERWALLPIENLSSTPLAGNQARSLVETHLRSRGIRDLEIFEVGAEQTLMALLDEAGQIASAKQWAIDNGFRFAITGNVQEWQYKNGLDNEPSVGMTLKFIDLQSDQVMWVASASRTGWGYQNLSSVASKTIGDLLAEVRFRQPKRSSTSRLAAVLPKRLPELPGADSQPVTQATLPEPAIGAANPASAAQSQQPAEKKPERKRPAKRTSFENSLLEP